MENLETIKKIKHDMTEFVFYNSEDLTDRQAELVGEIIDKLYDLIDELKK